MLAATVVVDRTCRKCRKRWRIVIAPMGRSSLGLMHGLDWTPVRP